MSHGRSLPCSCGPPQQSVSRDVVDISVEEMVFPTVDQRVADAFSKNTSRWDGFALKEEYPWIIEKPLVDFIKAKEPVGWLETTYRQPPPKSKRANAPSLESKQTANNGSFTIEFEYDRSRGENGWVAANNQQKISFVANSGVKFGANFSTEIAQLLTRVAYNRDYAGVTDAPAMPPIEADREADDYFQVLKAMYDRAAAFEKQDGATAGGSLKATYAGATSTLMIWLNGQQTYDGDTSRFETPVNAVEELQLQSHWGSGVRFKNIKISD